MPETALDWMAIGLLLLIGVGIGGAFFLYLRTSYRKGGWRRVGKDFAVAVMALLIWATVRFYENHEIQALKHAVGREFH
jgi:hypothetical protein